VDAATAALMASGLARASIKAPVSRPRDIRGFPERVPGGA
jgi:hypothetical protein